VLGGKRASGVLAGTRRNSTVPQVLLVDDSEQTRELVKPQLEGIGLSVVTAAGGEISWTLFQEHPFELVVTGLQLPELDGISLTRRIRSVNSRNIRVPVLLVTEFSTLSSAVAAGRAGVTDGFALDGHGITALVARARELIDADNPPTPYVLLGSSPAVVAARERILAVAVLGSPVLVSGESATGHSAAVAYLHALSPLSDSPLHRVDCTASRTLCDLPDQGSWYLEEVQELSREAQTRWGIWAHRSQLAGNPNERRLIASSTKDLRLLAAEKLFAPNLARQLCQLEIRLPPLRERRDDLPKLISAILEVVSERVGRPGIGISPCALELLCSRPWWGNFLKLESVLESLAAFSEGLEITEGQTELVLLDSNPIVRAARARVSSARSF